ncbi:MAG: TrkA family potassium uptake protein [Dehalococcoidia bacterium]
MYIIVVGGGSVGHGLALELQQMPDHEVTIVEVNSARAAQLRAELGEMVVHGDGSEIAFLDGVGAGRADLIIALTADDGANLVACQVSKHWFNVKRTIARVNDPRNEALFLRLGVDSIVSASGAVMAQIEATLPEHTIIPLMALEGSRLHVVDIRVQQGSPAAGRALRDLQFPPEVLVSVIIGKQGARVPDGDSVLQVGDEVIAVIPRESDAAVRSMIAGPVEGA